MSVRSIQETQSSGGPQLGPPRFRSFSFRGFRISPRSCLVLSPPRGLARPARSPSPLPKPRGKSSRRRRIFSVRRIRLAAPAGSSRNRWCRTLMDALVARRPRRSSRALRLEGGARWHRCTASATATPPVLRLRHDPFARVLQFVTI
ncbi:hypothetical protein GQ55_6G263500 [Panicum hallii var. hallii]|uniref:Uncharacterized protein n=2 Tax=Panicum hallii var. hallii TaxID=1504633 RepID=A0A2T7D9T7_9POAL|nr:hypothetical protein GQ55_6G263500 [Panicum hallii var. hallii]PUZ52361.1 hypothetical protein GQ55_6G263500 [Panicum hallii var. hallii]